MRETTKVLRPVLLGYWPVLASWIFRSLCTESDVDTDSSRYSILRIFDGRELAFGSIMASLEMSFIPEGAFPFPVRKERVEICLLFRHVEDLVFLSHLTWS